jgi:hypothetical protein
VTYDRRLAAFGQLGGRRALDERQCCGARNREGTHGSCHEMPRQVFLRVGDLPTIFRHDCPGRSCCGALDVLHNCGKNLRQLGILTRITSVGSVVTDSA